MKDLIIIGGGPAGITAAVYAARKQMDFSVITKDIGGQTAWSGEIENYTGYQFITGPDLAQKFRQHLEQHKFDLREGQEAAKVTKEASGFRVETSKGEALSARTLIIASGKKPRLLNVPGEAEFKNRGVTYCATCDGPLFAGKEVAVIGGGNSALDATLQMMKISPKVYLINIGEKLIGDPVMQEKVKASPVVEIHNQARTLEIKGEQLLERWRQEQAGRGGGDPLFEAFLRAFLTRSSSRIFQTHEDREILDVLQAAFEFAARRMPGERAVRLRHPEELPGRAAIELLQDDRPFLVDTLRLLLRRHGLREQWMLHPMLCVERGPSGELLHVFPPDEPDDPSRLRESFICVEVFPRLDAAGTAEFEADLDRVMTWTPPV